MVDTWYLKSSSLEIVSSVGPSGPQACVPHGEATTAAVQKLLSTPPARHPWQRPSPCWVTAFLRLTWHKSGSTSCPAISCGGNLGGALTPWVFWPLSVNQGPSYIPGMAVPLRGGVLLPAGTPELPRPPQLPWESRGPRVLSRQRLLPPRGWGSLPAGPGVAAPATEQPRGD